VPVCLRQIDQANRIGLLNTLDGRWTDGPG
jgi:hypothetical protein